MRLSIFLYDLRFYFLLIAYLYLLHIRVALSLSLFTDITYEFGSSYLMIINMANVYPYVYPFTLSNL